MPWLDDGLFVTVTPFPTLTTVTLSSTTITEITTSDVITTM
jgi:hypothetical protein